MTKTHTVDADDTTADLTPFQARMADNSGYYDEFSAEVALIWHSKYVSLEQVRAAKRLAHEAKLEVAFCKANLLESRVKFQSASSLPPHNKEKENIVATASYRVQTAIAIHTEAKLALKRAQIVARVTKDAFNAQTSES